MIRNLWLIGLAVMLSCASFAMGQVSKGGKRDPLKTLPRDGVIAVARWRHQPGGAVNTFYSNGKVNDQAGDHTWSLTNTTLVLRWKDARAPGGHWVDTCTVAPDGRTYNGTNQLRNPVSGILVAGRLPLPPEQPDGVKVVARWRHQPGDHVNALYSNGKVNDPLGEHTWTLTNNALVFRWKDEKAPGRFWVDTCTVSPDGQTYNGTNQAQQPISGTLANDLPAMPAEMPADGVPPPPDRAVQEETLDDLIKIVQNVDLTAETRRSAISRIAQMKDQAEPAIPLLTKQLADKQLCLTSIRTLGAIGKPAVPALIEALKTSYSADAARELIKLKTDAKPAIPALFACVLPDSPRTNRQSFFLALDAAQPDPEEYVPVLHKSIKAHLDACMRQRKNDYRDLAIGALTSLRKQGSHGKETVPTLIGYLRLSPSHTFSTEIVLGMQALESIGPDAKDALPVLRTFLNSGGLGAYAERAIAAISGSPLPKPIRP